MIRNILANGGVVLRAGAVRSNRSSVTDVLRQQKAFKSSWPNSKFDDLSCWADDPTSSEYHINGPAKSQVQSSIYPKDTVCKVKIAPQLTKIVGTIGPSSEQMENLAPIVKAGLRVMRLNFSHATVEEVELRVKNLRACQGRKGALEGRTENLRAILLDTRGPEIRTGKLADDTTGKYSITLEEGKRITLQQDKAYQLKSDSQNLYVDFKGNLAEYMVPGESQVLLDDGAVRLTVMEVIESSGGTSCNCLIENTGDVRSRVGVNMPGAAFTTEDFPPLTDKDKADIEYGLTKDIDYIAPSFVQNAASVHEIRNYVITTMDKLGLTGIKPVPLILSKIESASAVENFHEILEASDGIMVARGDLGVEIPIERVTNAQKEMVAACNAAGKPVIVATQMLESMTKNPRPTRAEVADVTNAVYDGADAVMLSGETAKGKYSTEVVKMMNSIIREAEKFMKQRPDIVTSSVSRMKVLESMRTMEKKNIHDSDSFTAVAKAAVTAAEERSAAAVIVISKLGRTAKMIAALHPQVPIVAYVPDYKIGRQLMIYRAVQPIVGQSGLLPHERPAAAVKDAKALGFVQEGDDVIIVMGESNDNLGDFITMRVATVQ